MGETLGETFKSLLLFVPGSCVSLSLRYKYLMNCLCHRGVSEGGYRNGGKIMFQWFFNDANGPIIISVMIITVL